MISKVIHMRPSRGRRGVEAVREEIFPLTRYVIDADPYKMLSLAAGEILSLSDYALHVRQLGIEPGEKVEAFGARNLEGDDLVAWQAQMLALAAQALRVRRKVIHIILSLPEGESWTVDEREETIDIVARVLGLDECPIVWAEHGNTAHSHLHLAIVRVGFNGQAAGSEWLIDDLHQAVAIVEERQKRKEEPHALYTAQDGAVFDRVTRALVRDASGRFNPGWYKELGVKRMDLPGEVRFVRDELIAARVGARDWKELHRNFSMWGATYDGVGKGGGRITVAGKSVKASALHPRLSRRDLEAAFGPFEPDPARADPRHETYARLFNEQLAMLRHQRSEACAELDAWVAATLTSLPVDEAARLRSTIEAGRDAARTSINAAFKTAIDAHVARRLNLASWMAVGSPAAPPTASVPALILPGLANVGERKDGSVEALSASQRDHQSRGVDDEGSKLFTDHGIAIVVHRTDPDAVAAALKVAASRWEAVRVIGSAVFITVAAEEAAKLGISLVDADDVPLLTPRMAPKAQRPTLENEDPSSGWTRRDHTADAEHQQRLAENAARDLAALAGLTATLGHLPLRREKDQSGQRTGALSVIVEDGPTTGNEIQYLSILEHHSEIQAALERSRKETLEKLIEAATIARSQRWPTNSSLWDVVRANNVRLAHAAYLARDDDDFKRAMRQINTYWKEHEAQQQQRQRELQHIKDAARQRKVARAEAVERGLQKARAIAASVKDPAARQQLLGTLADLAHDMKSGSADLRFEGPSFGILAMRRSLLADVLAAANTAGGNRALRAVGAAVIGFPVGEEWAGVETIPNPPRIDFRTRDGVRDPRGGFERD